MIAAELKSKLRAIENARGRMIGKVMEIDFDSDKGVEEEEDDDDVDEEDEYREEDMENRSVDEDDIGGEGEKESEHNVVGAGGRAKKRERKEEGEEGMDVQYDKDKVQEVKQEEEEEDEVLLGGFESALLGKLILMYGVKDFAVLATMLGEYRKEGSKKGECYKKGRRAEGGEGIGMKRIEGKGLRDDGLQWSCAVLLFMPLFVFPISSLLFSLLS